MNQLEEYYNKFNEEKRLNSRHGQVEYRISMEYIHKYIPKDREKSEIKILDIGAGTGRYSIPLFEEGYDVTAVELVQHNLGILKQKNSDIKAYKGNAMKLKRFANESFDVTLLFGLILVAYCMNEYSIITYAFKEKHILECLENGMIDEKFHTCYQKESLYDYVRTEDIEALNEACGLKRLVILSPDGAANYIRPFLNALSEEEFEAFVRYQMSVCEREDLLGAGAHIVDVLQK